MNLKDKIIGEGKSKEPEKLLENVDYYFENGLMVLTAHFLKKRGYCCDNGCRHCPYSDEDRQTRVNVGV